jgi:hypothetical protein
VAGGPECLSQVLGPSSALNPTGGGQPQPHSGVVVEISRLARSNGRRKDLLKVHRLDLSITHSRVQSTAVDSPPTKFTDYDFARLCLGKGAP